MAIAVTGLFIIALFAALYIGKALVLPLALAWLLSFVFRPLVRRLARFHVPAPITALLVISLISAALSFGVYSLAEPAEQWMKDVPRALYQLRYRAGDLIRSVEEAREATKNMDILEDDDDQQVVVKEESVESYLFTFTQQAMGGLLTTLVLLFFILGWGERFYRNLVNAQLQFTRQRQIVHIVHDIELSVSSYLLTITVINSLLGVVIAVALYLLDVPNAALWGVVTAALNYVPYLGPAVTAGILAVVSLLTFDSLGKILLVPLVFLAITTVEGYFITPMAVGRQLTLNPLVIFLALIFLFALWGFVGALLTVPILACIKVTLERIDATRPYAAILD